MKIVAHLGDKNIALTISAGVALVILAMLLSIATFGWAATLGPGQAVGFALVCVLSGAALGADMIMLPALFSSRLAGAGLQAGRAFAAKAGRVIR